METVAFRKIAGQVFRYGIVGIIGTILHIGTLVLLVERFQLEPVLSSIIGFLIAFIISYFLNFFWVFNSSREHLITSVRYLVVSVFGLVLSTLIMYTVVDILRWWYGWGALCIILVIPVSNFILNYLWTFGAQDAP